jgi:hypothetical protein
MSGRRPQPSWPSRAGWSSRAYGMLVLDVGVTWGLSRRARGLRLVLWGSRKATSMHNLPMNQKPTRGEGNKEKRPVEVETVG